MDIVQISKGGQISIPARIRNRWGVSRIYVDDRGDRIVLVPVPDDPIRAVRGSLPAVGRTVEDDRRQMREEEAEADARRREP